MYESLFSLNHFMCMLCAVIKRFEGIDVRSW